MTAVTVEAKFSSRERRFLDTMARSMEETTRTLQQMTANMDQVAEALTRLAEVQGKNQWHAPKSPNQVRNPQLRREEAGMAEMLDGTSNVVDL